MKITAGTLITADHEVRLLRRKLSLGRFDDLNALRHHLTELDFIPKGDWNDFGRGSQAVRLLMVAGMLTAGDSDCAIPESAGVIGWNGSGCTAENLRFWRDYIQNGRINGRGGLFVATLPTIPFCEAAITLGCRGPSAYLRTEPSVQALFRLLAGRPAGWYFIGEVTEKSVCMLLTENDGNLPVLPEVPTLEELFLHLEKET